MSGFRLIALTHGADLDGMGAARLLSLRYPDARLLHPTRLAQNAWEFVRHQSWFRTIAWQAVDWSRVAEVHLVGVFRPHHHPEIIERLTSGNCPTRVWATGPAQLPFSFSAEPVADACLTTALLAARIAAGHAVPSLPVEDQALCLMALTEKTWAGLSSRATEADLRMLEELRSLRPVPVRQVSNSIVLGQREGQKGLLNDLLAKGEDLEINDWPVLVSVVRTMGLVQDLRPVVEAFWCRQDPHLLVAGIVGAGLTRVFARSRGRSLDLRRVFQTHRPKDENGWLEFQLKEGDSELVREILIGDLAKGLPPDAPAASFMTVSPRCVEPSMTIAAAQELMRKFHLMSLVVVEEERLIGVITRRDLDRGVQMGLLDSPIAPFIPSQTPMVSPDTPARVVRRLMLAHSVTRLPVVAEERVVGIITARDLLRALEDQLPLPRRFLAELPPTLLPGPERMEDRFRRTAPPALLKLLRRIGERAAERQIQAHLVGGFVRDLLLERRTVDLDVVLTGDALPFARALAEEWAAEIVVFERFRTARLNIADWKIDFSTARIEHYAEAGALPEVERSGIANDLARRDFTINALALDLRPGHFLRLIDVFGGTRDLAEHRIRILHPFSFLEDPTRMFRAIRFAARFDFQLSDDTRRALDLAIDRGVLNNISKKRILAEVTRCFQEEFPARVVERLFQYDLCRALHPELTRFALLPARFGKIRGILRQFAGIGEPIDGEAVHWVGLLMPLPVAAAEELLLAGGMDQKRRRLAVAALQSLVAVPGTLAKLAPDDALGLYRLLIEYPIEALIALLAFGLDKEGQRRVLDFMARLRPIKPGVTGRDLIAAGIPSGPAIGKILEAIVVEKLNGRLGSPQEELSYARGFFARLHLS